MGVDVTFFAEKYDGEKWVYEKDLFKTFLPERNYHLFAVLGYSHKSIDYINPIAELKGLPSNCSEELKVEIDRYNCLEAYTYITLAEIINYDWTINVFGDHLYEACLDFWQTVVPRLTFTKNSNHVRLVCAFNS